MDATGQLEALFPTPAAASSPMALAVEVIVRLRASFESTGFSADVGGVTLMSGGEAATFVIEIRNREESGDDSVSGYDLVVIMQPDQTGNWTVTSATKQTICSRGLAPNTAPPLCL